MSQLFFSTIEITRQVFHRTSLSFAIVNLKPIVPGHVLVCPARPVPRLSDLNTAELTALMISVQNVGRVIEREYHADGLTVACQDGKAAGQTIPHVHFHLLPRKFEGDAFGDQKDDVYPAIERHEGDLPKDLAAPATERRPERFKVDADENRKSRTMEEMETEAKWLRSFFDEDGTPKD